MKTLQFVADGAPGGGTNHVMQLLTGLGDDVENVLLTQKDSYLYDLAKSKNISVVGGDFFRSRLDREAIRKVRETIETEKPDLVHCHGGRAGFFQSFLSRKTPTVYTVHGFHHARKSFVPRTSGWAAEMWTMSRMDQILFVADFDRQLAVRQKLLRGNKSFQVIHNGIAPLEPQSGSESLGIGFIGRFVYQKNPQLFLEVVKRLPDQNFVMAGGGELEPEIREMVKQLGLEDRVKLLGSLDHKAALEFISKLDVLVMTPRWEGLPLLPLEAMFMKVPVVSTAVGGIPEVIEHGETGLLSSEDADELAKNVNVLINDAEIRSSIKRQAFEAAHEKFSQKNMLAKIKRSYGQLLERRMVSRQQNGQLVPGFNSSMSQTPSA